MKKRMLALAGLSGIAASVAVGLSFAQAPTSQISSGNSATLKQPSEFASISDRAEKSRAIYGEVAKVLMHPRCTNCHPAGDRPLQGANGHPHLPPVFRGEAGNGVAGTSCTGCHTEANVTLREKASYQSIPGNPRWSLAPLSMAWEGKSAGDICRQIKDKDRNGGRDLTMLHEHIAQDDLVGWGWKPGEGREPAPGTRNSRANWYRRGSTAAPNVRDV